MFWTADCFKNTNECSKLEIRFWYLINQGGSHSCQINFPLASIALKFLDVDLFFIEVIIFYIDLRCVFKISLKCASLIFWPCNCMNWDKYQKWRNNVLKNLKILSIKSSIKCDNTNKCCCLLLNLKLHGQIHLKLWHGELVDVVLLSKCFMDS